MPEQGPTALRVGERLTVRVLKQNKPLAGFVLGAVAEGDKKGLLKTTDADGRVTFTLARAGRWLLRGTELRPSRSADTDWDSDFVTLTFAVRPE